MILSGNLLLDRWKETLRGRPETAAVLESGMGTSHTFRALQNRVQAITEQWRAIGVVEGNIIAVQLPACLDFIASFLAAQHLNAVFLPAELDLTSEERERVFQKVGAGWLMTAKGLEALHHSGSPELRAGTALLKMTSGSTGEPRCVAFSSEQLVADADQIVETMEFGSNDINIGCISITHSYGFSNLVLPLILHGIPLVLTQPFFPETFRAAVLKYRPTLFSGVPLMYEILHRMEWDRETLGSIRTFISAGAPLEANKALEFKKKYGRCIHNFYGSSECGGICYGTEPGTVGRPMKNVRLELVEMGDYGDPQAGRVVVYSRSAGLGYFPAISQDLEDLRNGRFATGDIGRWTASGDLELIGRVRQFINVAGRKVNPREVELCLASLTNSRIVVGGIPDGSRGEMVIAVCLMNAPSDQVLLKECHEKLAAYKVPRKIFRMEQFPYLSSGKLDRSKVLKFIRDQIV